MGFPTTVLLMDVSIRHTSERGLFVVISEHNCVNVTLWAVSICPTSLGACRYSTSTMPAAYVTPKRFSSFGMWCLNKSHTTFPSYFSKAGRQSHIGPSYISLSFPLACSRFGNSKQDKRATMRQHPPRKRISPRPSTCRLLIC